VFITTWADEQIVRTDRVHHIEYQRLDGEIASPGMLITPFIPGHCDFVVKLKPYPACHRRNFDQHLIALWVRSPSDVIVEGAIRVPGRHRMRFPGIGWYRYRHHGWCNHIFWQTYLINHQRCRTVILRPNSDFEAADR
jgi:hypothetical protein